MSRDIKFRAWDKDRKIMVYQLSARPCFGIFEGDNYASIEDVLFYEKGDFELLQFTGRTDRNGKEIYEGDIIPLKIWIPEVFYKRKKLRQPIETYTIQGHGHYETKNYTVAWSDMISVFSTPCFVLKNGNDIKPLSEITEVIGNIYEGESHE